MFINSLPTELPDVVLPKVPDGAQPLQEPVEVMEIFGVVYFTFQLVFCVYKSLKQKHLLLTDMSKVGMTSAFP